MPKKSSGPQWFKFWGEWFPMIEAAPDEAVGKAVKGALRYFRNLDIPPMNDAVRMIYQMLVNSIEEAKGDYQKSSEAGKKGNAKRWHKDVSEGDTT